MADEKTSVNSKDGASATKKADFREPGWKDMRSTSAFRALNFELFVKPNKWVMGFGLVALSCCVGYLGYMRAQAENRQDLYTAMNQNEEFVVKKRPSRWD